MSGGLRKQVLLNHLQKIQEVIGGDSNDKSNEQGSHSANLPNTLHSSKTSTEPSFVSKQSLLSEAQSEICVKWDQFFTEKRFVQLSDRSHNFNYYCSVPDNCQNEKSIPIFIFHHGAGSSGLTFASLCKELYERLDSKCGCFTFDARGHGETVPCDPSNNIKNSYDRTAFVDDFVSFINFIYDNYLTHLPLESVSIILVGHSLGGSICTFALDKLRHDVKRHTLGVAMFDIVEEAAIQALQTVQSFLFSTPNKFRSYQEAIDWHVNNGLSRLRSSAEISIPAVFKKLEDGSVVRKTDLRVFSKYWDTWFIGLSHQFVIVPKCKLLILAGNDNLDKELIIGQMQGKYQLVVFQDSGHFIQEDCPMKCALTLIDFWKRNDNKNVVIKTNWGKN